MGQHLVAAFPVWRARRYDGEVQATEHPDTGKWWFRRTYVEPIFHQGRWVDVYKMGKWECPVDQPENPVVGMQLMRKRDHTGRPIYKKAMLPIDPSTPLPPKRPRGRPRKERHDDQERHPQS